MEKIERTCSLDLTTISYPNADLLNQRGSHPLPDAAAQLPSLGCKYHACLPLQKSVEEHMQDDFRFETGWVVGWAVGQFSPSQLIDCANCQHLVGEGEGGYVNMDDGTLPIQDDVAAKESQWEHIANGFLVVKRRRDVPSASL
jgi:hypothetical protein